MPSRLETKLDAIRANPNSNEFIIADAKDADMAFGVAATGPSANGQHPSLADYRQKIREVVEQNIVDIVIMSASTSEQLVIDERIFDKTEVTPAARANDTSDIWLPRHGKYTESPSRPYCSATIDHIQCGRDTCSIEQRRLGTNLGLYSITFNNDVDHDHASLSAFNDFRAEAESKDFEYFLEVFAPNIATAVAPERVGHYLNDMIARTLGGITSKNRPLFLKMPYCGPDALEELVAYDPSLIVGILGGASGTMMDAFTLLAETKKHGGRAALFGRKINNAEDQLLMIELLRQVADGNIQPREAVNTYHKKLEDKRIIPFRSTEDDLKITAPGLAYV
ncbi:MAG: hypothetical protein VCC01_12345 [Candidatus Hydrogenedentota bacterium]